MMHLGMGYELWARIVDKTLTTDKLDNFPKVADEAKEDPLLIQKCILSSWDPVNSTQLASNNGPCGTITNLQSDDYPQAAHNIKKFFPSNLPIPGFPQAMAAPGTFTFQLTGVELEKETEAKKGSPNFCFYAFMLTLITKDCLSAIFCLLPSNGMEVVLSHPRAAWSTYLANLICQTLLMTKEQDHLSI